MPLVWAHAELLKLLAAGANGRSVELLDVVRERYASGRPAAATWYWRDEVPVATLPRGRRLVIEDRVPFVLHLSVDAWKTVGDRDAQRLGLGMWGVPLRSEEIAGTDELRFTRYYPSAGRWEGADHAVSFDETGGRDRSRVQPPRMAKPGLG